jgi:hypothetical protein
VPKPSSPETTVQPVASQAIHLSVKEVPRLNPDGVLPVALGVPIGLSVLMIILRIVRRRGTR